MMKPKILKTLTELAIANNGVKRYKIAAGIVLKGRLIATGVNSYKTHPMMLNFQKNEEAIHLHAEVDAIRNALRFINVDDFQKVSLCVVRVRGKANTNDYFYGLAKPCGGCMKAIVEFGIPEVFYTESENERIDLNDTACRC